MTQDALRIAVSSLLLKAGVRGDFDIIRLAEGERYRGFQVRTAGASFFLKEYVKAAGEAHDRLTTEFAFASYAWKNGLRQLPQPIGCDREHNLGLFEFIAGRRVLAQDINDDTVNQILDFLLTLNRNRRLVDAQSLGRASEACFTFNAHFEAFTRRLKELKAMPGNAALDKEAYLFVKDELEPAWKRTQAWVVERAKTAQLDLDQKLPEMERMLSPGDFGFHSLLLAHDGRARFIDFEYAGWDDPARVICDLFCRADSSVPIVHFNHFTRSVAELSANPESLICRVLLLLPVYRLKWCCLLLEVFRHPGLEARKLERLARAREYLRANGKKA